MSKVTDLGMNLVPSRLPKKNIVATEKAEEITSKIHAIVAEPITEPIEPTPALIVEKALEPEPKVQEVKPKTQNAKLKTTPSVKKRSARTIIEDPDAVRKTSFDFPVALYRSMKIRLAEDGLSMRDYVIGLIEDDLNK